MPLSRYLVRNEYGLADPELYRAADKDDPEALLEGVAMAGLVGVLRQLGDLAEFAAEMFHDLHEEVMATASRGHALIARVQQLEAEFPSAEKTLLSQTSHIPLLYSSGVDWHPSIRMDENLVTQSDMPRFVMDSYEECRGPPRLFLLDKFDVAGAGACLKRYTDPSCFKAESTDFSIKKSEGQREKRIRKVKRRGLQWRNGDIPEAFPSSHAKLHQLLLEERIETGANDPERRVKLKKRQLDGFKREDKLKSYMQKVMDTYSSDKVVHEISLDLVPMNLEPTSDTFQSGLEIVEIDTFSPSRDQFYRDKAAYSSFSKPEMVKSSVNELNELTDGRTVEIPGTNYEADVDNLSLFNKDVTHEELAGDTGRKSEGSEGDSNVDDVVSEIENYVDALATMESETETDSDYRKKGDRRYPNKVKKMIDSDGSEEKQQQNKFLDYHSVGNSTISDDGSLLKKDIDSFSCSDNVSNFAEDATVEPSAKCSTAGPVNPLADSDKSFTREAQGNKIGEYIASDDAESMQKNALVQSAKYKELPWISVNVGTALTKKGNEGMGQTDLESKEVVARAVPNSSYGHLTSVGILPVDEMVDASSVSSSEISLGHSRVPEETSSHPQSECDRDCESPLFIEMKSSSSASSAEKPFPCEDNDLTPITEEKSEDQLCLSGVVLGHEQPKGHDAEELYVSMPNQLDLSEDALQPGASDVDGIVEPKVLTAAISEDSSAQVADRESPAMEIHYSLEPLCFEGSESIGRFEFDSSENKVADSVDESSVHSVCESTAEQANMSRDDSSNLNLVVIPSEVHSQSDQVSQIPDAPVLYGSHMDEAGGSASATVADIENLSQSVCFDKDESQSLDTFRNPIDHPATYLGLPGPVLVSSSHACLVYDMIEPIQADRDTICFDDITPGKDAAISSATISSDSPFEHLSEGKNDLDLEHLVQVLDHSETNFSSVRDCSSARYPESVSIGEVPYLNKEGSQIQSLQCQAEGDLLNPVSCGRDDCINSDSTVCDISTVLRSADNVPETFLAEGSQTSLNPTSSEEALLSSEECVHHLERANSSHYHVEDEEHFVNAFDNVHTNTQIALDSEIETQGIEMTVESFNAVAPLEYFEKNLPPKDGGNELCINPIFVSSLCTPLSQHLVSDLSVHSGDYKVESQFVEGEPSASVSVSPPREPLVAEKLASSADHELQSSWQAMEKLPTDCSSISGFLVKAQESLKIENAGRTMDLLQVNLPPFGRSSYPTHIKSGEMPPLPPLPPIQWRLGRNQHTSPASECLMQQPFGAMQRLDQPETSDNAGLRSQSSLGAQHLNPFLSLSGEVANSQHVTEDSGGYVQQPTVSVLSMPNISHEDGPHYTISLDQRHEDQLFTGSQDDLLVPASDAPMNKLSMTTLHSGLMADDATLRIPELIQTETMAVHEQCEHISSPAVQETIVVGEQLEYQEDKEIATTSAQFETPVALQYGNQLSHGFMAPERQGIWPADVFETGRPEHVNGSLQKKIQRPRNPLIDAVVAVDKSKLRKIGEIVKPQDQPEAENREQHLLQLRKVGERVRPQDAVKDEESFRNFPPLRKMGERIKPQDLPSTDDSVQHLPQLRKVEERIKPQDEPNTVDEKQNLLPLKGVGGGLKPQEGLQPENKDWLEQIRNQSFNLKPATTTLTSRPSIQSRQTNLKVAAILEKASMIRQAIAGNDEDDSDGWSDS